MMSEQEPDPRDLSTVTADLESFGFDDPQDRWIERLRTAERQAPLGRIGSIEIVEEVSRGGQGIVYRAQQAGLGRPIAVKKLRSGLLATPHMRRRFEREIEIVSALNHPNIVRLFGLDVSETEPLLTMEWIDGQPVNEWADGIRQNESAPLLKLLGVFQGICEAVKYAHEHGVIHRDLKPSNILIDQDDAPHLVDFGLAKPLSESVLLDASFEVTGQATFLGTPAYASPEQIEGKFEQVDTRSDVYSLGVILYEMICGGRPYDLGDSWTDAIRRIEHVEPHSMTHQADFPVDRDLEAIVLKALSRDRDERYQSVESLLSDIHHFLRGEAVSAQSPTLTYQVRKLLHRHRNPVLVSASAVVLVLVAAIIITTISIQAAQKQKALRQEADLQTGNARKLYERAEEARADAEAQADRAGEIHRFFDWLLTSVAPQAGKGPNVTVREVLDGADQYVATFLADKPEAEASIRGTIASAYNSLGLFDEAVRHCRIALNARIALYGDDDRRTAISKGNLAAALLSTNQSDQAVRLEREAVEYFRKHSDEDLDRLVHELCTLAEILRRNERYDEAESLFQEAHDNLVKAELAGSPADAIALNGLGALYFNRKEYDKAEAVLEQLLQGDAQPGVTAHRVGRATILNNLAGARMGLGDLEGAEEAIREALDIAQHTAGPEHPSTARYMGNLAQLLVKESKYEESEGLFKQAIPITEKAFGASSPDTAAVYQNYAGLLAAMDRPDEADAYFRKSLDLCLAFDHGHEQQTRRLVDQYAAFLIDQHRDADAQALRDHVYGKSNPDDGSSTDQP